MKYPVVALLAAACGAKSGTTTPDKPDPSAPRTEVTVCAPKQECVTPAPAGGSYPRGTKFVIAATWPDQQQFGAAVTCSGTVRCDVSAPRAESGSLVFDVTTTTAGALTMSVDLTASDGGSKTIAIEPYTIVD